MIKQIALVALGGGVGSAMRFLISCCISKLFHGGFPLGTFIVNMLGCFIMGMLLELSAEAGWFDDNLKWLLMPGFCGGFTTFSAFSAENIALLQSGQYFTFGIYAALSVVLCILAVAGGMVAARTVFS